MAMTDRDREHGFDHGLEAFFDAAKAAPEPASLALMTRVMQDAQAVQGGLVPGGDEAARTGFFAMVLKALGGWPALGGLVTATVTGVWIGFSPVLGVGTAVTTALGTAASEEAYLDDYLAGFDFAFEDGAVEGGAG